VGPTASTNFPTTADAFQPANAGGADLGIVLLDRYGKLSFSSYLGGSGDDDGGSPMLDNHGALYFGGATSSTDFPVTRDAIHPTYGGGDIDGPLAPQRFVVYARRVAREYLPGSVAVVFAGVINGAPVAAVFTPDASRVHISLLRFGFPTAHRPRANDGRSSEFRPGKLELRAIYPGLGARGARARGADRIGGR
jgi:hypothetical protein